jgi:hypothetical protein
MGRRIAPGSPRFPPSTTNRADRKLKRAVSADRQQDGDSFDVVLVHGKTTDGEGACVLRARPGKLEAGEVRPLRHGRPVGAGEIVSLTPRQESPDVYDVKTVCELPAGAARAPSEGPAQVATDAYRDAWERTFGAARTRAALN